MKGHTTQLRLNLKQQMLKKVWLKVLLVLDLRWSYGHGWPIDPKHLHFSVESLKNRKW